LGKIEFQVLRRGFHPKGGGLIRLKVEGKKDRAGPLHLVDSTNWDKGTVRLAISSVWREHGMVERILAGFEKRGIACLTSFEDTDSPGLAATMHTTGGIGNTLGTTALGQAKTRPDDFVTSLVQEFERLRDHPAPVEYHLADQLVPLLAVCGGKMRCQALSLHCLTNMEICTLFSETKFKRDKELITATLAP
jgi:RNA 3'-terminal phosphate cyclase (ATP)